MSDKESIDDLGCITTWHCAKYVTSSCSAPRPSSCEAAGFSGFFINECLSQEPDEDRLCPLVSTILESLDLNDSLPPRSSGNCLESWWKLFRILAKIVPDFGGKYPLAALLARCPERKIPPFLSQPDSTWTDRNPNPNLNPKPELVDHSVHWPIYLT